MMKVFRDNKGVTLIEVLVATVLLGFVVLPTLNTFSLARYTNVNTEKYLEAEQLSTALVEKFRDVSFKEIADMCEYKNGPAELYNEANDILKAKVSDADFAIAKVDDDTYTLTANVRKKRENFKVTIDVHSDNSYAINEYKFPVLENIYMDNTCVINPTGDTIEFNKSDDGYIQLGDTIKYYEYNTKDCYDNRVIDFYVNAHENYVRKKWKKKCDEIDKFNKAHEKEGIKLEYPEFGVDEFELMTVDEIKKLISKETYIEVRQGTTFTFVNSNITYKLDQMASDGWKEVIEPEENKEAVNKSRQVEYTLNSKSKYMHLNNLYYMIVPLSSGWKSDTTVIKNGNSLSSVNKFNLFIDVQPFDSDGNEYSGTPDIKIESASPEQDIVLYTNCDGLDRSTNMSIANTVKNIERILTKHEQPQRRGYTMDISIENQDGSTLYNKKTSNNISWK